MFLAAPNLMQNKFKGKHKYLCINLFMTQNCTFHNHGAHWNYVRNRCVYFEFGAFVRKIFLRLQCWNVNHVAEEQTLKFSSQDEVCNPSVPMNIRESGRPRGLIQLIVWNNYSVWNRSPRTTLAHGVNGGQFGPDAVWTAEFRHSWISPLPYLSWSMPSQMSISVIKSVFVLNPLNITCNK